MITSQRSDRFMHGKEPREHRQRARRAPMVCACLAWIALFAGLTLSAGCAHDGAAAAPGVDTLRTPLPSSVGQGEARLFFYRITSSKTGERLGSARSFAVEPERQVRAVVQLEGVDTSRDIMLHVMWINPDGLEVFTKEAFIKPSDWRDPARRDELARGLVQLDPAKRMLDVESRYGVDPIRFEEEAHKDEESRRFKTGTWEIKVYLFRRLIMESTFELTNPA